MLSALIPFLNSCSEFKVQNSQKDHDFDTVKPVVEYEFLSIKLRFFSLKYVFLCLKSTYKLNISVWNTNLVINQGKSIDQLFDLVLIPNCMSSIGIGIQKLAIHSQLIGLKTALKISDIIKKDSDDEIEYEAE